jgi:hypothetical protein
LDIPFTTAHRLVRELERLGVVGSGPLRHALVPSAQLPAIVQAGRSRRAPASPADANPVDANPAGANPADAVPAVTDRVDQDVV